MIVISEDGAKLTPTVKTSGTDASGKMTFVVNPGDGTAAKAFLRIRRQRRRDAISTEVVGRAGKVGAMRGVSCDRVLYVRVALGKSVVAHKRSRANRR